VGAADRARDAARFSNQVTPAQDAWVEKTYDGEARGVLSEITEDNRFQDAIGDLVELASDVLRRQVGTRAGSTADLARDVLSPGQTTDAQALSGQQALVGIELKDNVVENLLTDIEDQLAGATSANDAERIVAWAVDYAAQRVSRQYGAELPGAVLRRVRELGRVKQSLTAALRRGLPDLINAKLDQTRFSNQIKRARPDLTAGTVRPEVREDIEEVVDETRGKPSAGNENTWNAQAETKVQQLGGEEQALREFASGAVTVPVPTEDTPEQLASVAVWTKAMHRVLRYAGEKYYETRNIEYRDLARETFRRFRSSGSAISAAMRARRADIAAISDNPAENHLAALRQAAMASNKSGRVEAMLRNQFGIDLGKPDMAKLNDKVAFDKMMRAIKQQDSTVSDYLFEYWINWGLLSGPATPVVNVLGTSANIVTELTAQRLTEAVITPVVEAVTGKKVKGGSRLGEFKQMWKALAPSWRMAATAMKTAFMTEVASDNRKAIEYDGYIPEEVRLSAPQFKSDEAILRDAREEAVQKGIADPDAYASKALEAAHTKGVKVPFIKGSVVRLPGRLNMAADEFMKTIVRRVEGAAFAYREGTENELKGKDLENYIAQQLANPDSAASLYGQNQATILAFQGEGGMLTAAMLKAKGDPRGKWLRWLFPFVRTPANIIGLGARKSPLGTIPLALKTIPGEIRRYMSDPKAFAIDAKAVNRGAEQVLAWGTVMALYSLMGNDDDEPWITGSRPDYRSGEYNFRMNNMPPQSFRIGDTWYSYGRLDPAATILTSIVDGLTAMENAKSGKDGKKIVDDLLRSGKSVFRDKTYLQTVGDIIRATESESAASNLAENFASSFVPNLVRSARRAADPMVRETAPKEGQTFGERVMNRAQITHPFPRVDVWGNDIEQTGFEPDIGQFLWRLTMPAYIKHADGLTPAEQVLWNWNMQNPNAPYWPKPGRLNGFTTSEAYKYAKLRGQEAKKRVDRLVLSGRISPSAPTEKDIELLKRSFSKATRIASKQVRRIEK